MDHEEMDVSQKLLELLQRVERNHGYNSRETLELGVVTLEVLLNAVKEGNVTIIATPEGKALQEIRLPPPISSMDSIVRKMLDGVCHAPAADPPDEQEPPALRDGPN